MKNMYLQTLLPFRIEIFLDSWLPSLVQSHLKPQVTTKDSLFQHPKILMWSTMLTLFGSLGKRSHVQIPMAVLPTIIMHQIFFGDFHGSFLDWQCVKNKKCQFSPRKL